MMGKVRATVMAALLTLAACGQTITITLPGGESGNPVNAPAMPETPDYGLALSPPPPGWERLFSVTPWGMRMTGPGEPTRRGALAERFELRVGDCAGGDCAAGRSRAELRELKPAFLMRPGQEAWYGWSFLNANLGPVARNADPGVVLAQWKTEGEAPAFLRILRLARGEGNWDTCDPTICNRVGSPADDVVVELTDMKMAAGWGPAQNEGAVCRLFSSEASRGRWVDIVLSTNFAADGNGFLRVWVNGELKCNYYGRVVATTSGWGSGPTQRHGLFAPSLSRVAARGVQVPPMVVYYDEFLAGRTRNEVDPRAREALSQPARD
jgi:Polysaccharide lyase